ncbi:MAG: SMI1/KNR4 family protein [Chloroflexota bacterium]
MSLNKLLNVLPAPTSPIETITPDQWETFELSTGMSLPSDYKEYLGIFGTGVVGGVITPYNPFCKRTLLRASYTCRNWMGQAIAISRHKQQFGTEVFPYPLYPEPDGVLPWGATDNGDQLFWLTTGSPNEWSVVINEVRSSIFEQFACSMTAFLHDLIIGNIQSKIIPHHCLDRDYIFEPLV